MLPCQTNFTLDTNNIIPPCCCTSRNLIPSTLYSQSAKKFWEITRTYWGSFLFVLYTTNQRSFSSLRQSVKEFLNIKTHIRVASCLSQYIAKQKVLTVTGIFLVFYTDNQRKDSEGSQRHIKAVWFKISGTQG